ncbi:MAG: hypothetical protein J6B47_05330 [Prevotella sp.]|nr:hypothetical protein [Prevotella sp.]
MIKSINMMKSRRYNIIGHAITHVLQFISCPTYIVRRAALVFALMMAVVGSVEAKERVLYDYSTEGGTNQELVINANSFTENNIGSILRVYVSNDNWLQLRISPSEIFNVNGGYINNYENYSYITFNSAIYSFDFELTADIISAIKEKASFIIQGNAGKIIKIVVDEKEVDDFEGKLSDDCIQIEQNKNIDSKAEKYFFDFSEVLTSLPDVKYARFYLIKGNENQDIAATSIAISSNNGKTCEDKPNRGVYVYTGSPLTADDLKGTLTLVPGTFYDYQFVAVFSKDAPQEVSDDGIVTKEPAELQEKYIVNFTVPITIIDKYIKWDKSEDYFDVSDMPELLGTTIEEMKNKYSIKWYVLNENGERQDFQNSWKLYAEGGMYPYTYNSPEQCLSLNEKSGYYENNNLETAWKNNEKWHLQAPKISCPSNTFESYKDYTVVCDAEIPTAKAKYIFHFNENGVEPDPFEGDMTGATEVSYERGLKENSTSVTIDFGSELTGAKYARYYLVNKDGSQYEANDEAISVADGVTINNKKSGVYVYNAGSELTEVQKKVMVTLPAGKFYDYQLVAMLSDQEPEKDGDKIIKDAVIKKKVVYTFKEAFVFIHSKGASGRDYIIGDNTENVMQYAWNGACTDLTGGYTETTEDIRQGVYTVKYDMYVDPDVSDLYPFKMPFQNYNGEGGGNDLEPSAYIRWYDWKTDFGHEKLVGVGSNVKDLTEVTDDGDKVSRGLFMVDKTHSKSLKSSEAGAAFNASGFGKDDVVTIACDASKYYDGISGSTEYPQSPIVLVHEPTIGTRYLFTIRHASVIADKLVDGKTKYETNDSKQMFQLTEDNGRFCVSVKDNSTAFSVRSSCPYLSDYYMYKDDSKTTFVKADKLGWEVYLEDGDGLWKRDNAISAGKNRIQTHTVVSIGGIFTLVSDGTRKKTVTADAGMRFHLVGILEDETGTIKYPAIHYEMNFIQAPAYHSGNIPLQRTKAYLEANMTLQAQLTFDEQFEPLSTEDPTFDNNHTTTPLAWDEAEYGFCYPQLAEYHTNKNYMKLSPIHGDYIILKTMNVVKGNGYNDYKWWDSAELQDFTYRFGGENKYGGFLYVDASDESRTIAKLRFDNAKLCVGSELCYTAVISDMTDGKQTAPRLLTALYAIRGGEKIHVASFLSCNLRDVSATGEAKKGLWYQVYGRIAVPSNVDLTGVDSYEVHVDNYADNTQGADYCVDQIMFFTSNAKVKVKQVSASCSEENVHINAYLSADALDTYKREKIYWRICDEDGKPLTNESKIYGEDGSLTYGTIEVPLSYDATTLQNIDSFTEKNGYFFDEYGNVAFSLINDKLNLKQGQQYYFSVYQLGQPAVDTDIEWGNPNDPCTIFSPIFVPRKMHLLLTDKDGNAQTAIGACGGGNNVNVDLKAEVNIPDDSEVTGFKSYKDVHFDFFMGSLKEYSDYCIKINDGGTEREVHLEEALKYYRGRNITGETEYNDWIYKSAITLDEAAFKEGETTKSGCEGYYDVINNAINEGKLILQYSTKLETSITVKADQTTLPISALPVEQMVTMHDANGEIVKDKDNNPIKVEICSPLEFTFDVNATGDGPTMQLGFEDVAYPEDYVRVVRVGREQLLNMQKKDGYLLHVPVNNFNIGSGDDNTGALVIVGNLELLKEGTTDPTISGNNNKVATFAADEEVSAEKMYVSLNFHGEGVTQPDFREGFAYRMFFQVKKKDAGEGACTGNVEFILKVVPEFVTWTGKAGDTNTSWNNDANWTRSKCEELYKHDGQNTPTAAQGDGTNNGKYVDNDDATLGRPDTYVPMKFTYVTMPTHNRAPVLAALTKGIDGIYNNVESGATEKIQYDIMVRTETVCMDENHAKNGNSSIYDCEKFYGNCCKEIYFKPEAELVNQQHLMYEKAWVEKELVPAAWYLMSSPLMSVYSGDMYVPKSNGRQETEAFKPIMFNNELSSYSRTKYPVYQRSWKQEGAKVYTKKIEFVGNDVLNETYSANLPYDGVVEETMAQWSHVYNDLAVRDTTLMGFSIRAHKEKQAENALLRLPKEDLTQYDFFSWNDSKWDDEGGFPSMGIEKCPNVHGHLKTDCSDNAVLSTGIDLIQVNNGYALIGNPYMSSVRMSKFLEQNSSMIDGNAFWTYEVSDDGTSTELRAHGGSGTIRPMQAFFVKLRDDVVETDEITFTSDMMIDGNTSPETETAAAGVRMMAINSKGQSTAVVAHVDGSCNGYDVGEDVETFFDSNFSDAPTVYTVAGTKAVSVNSLPNIDIVPFGVTCAGNDAVDVTITGTDLITQKLYVYDTANGMCAEIHDGEPISVQPNDYGRYYLTTRSSMNIGESVAQGIMVSVRDGQVTVTTAKNIRRVVVTTLNGANQLSLADCGMSATFTLHQGVYIIEVEGDAGKNTVKIMVK